MILSRSSSTLFPYTTLFRSIISLAVDREGSVWIGTGGGLSRFANNHFSNFRVGDGLAKWLFANRLKPPPVPIRSEEHTSELQSSRDTVCRLSCAKKK